MKNRKVSIALFGADGQLGMDLQKEFSDHTVTPLTYAEPDILDRARVAEKLRSIVPEWVINAAALTNVEWCESNDVKAFEVNALGARNVAEASAAVGARMIQISTDYVFDGKKKAPYTEEDTPRPLNAYGITKLAGEHYVRRAQAKHYIVRSSGLYGTHPSWGKGRNFVDTMLALALGKKRVRVVCDEVVTPTFTQDFAHQLRRLIETEPSPGIYHATNEGECSWFEFAKTIFELEGVDVTLESTSAAEWKSPVTRPAYSVLDNAALRRAGIDAMPHWKDALQRYLTEKARAT